MKKILPLTLVLVLVLAGTPALANGPDTKNYGDVTLSGGFQAGHFLEWWDLTAGDLVLSFTYDATGLVDDLGGAAHAWGELGVRSPCYGDFNPTWMAEGAGVWLATDYEWSAGTFDPDPPGSPISDLDDKLILQKAGGHGEGDYNLPSTPPSPGANHRVWFDRDGVDQWQAMNPLAVDGGTYNTEGTYDVVITLHATSDTAGTAYMTINRLDQGFETDGNWKTMELTPAGMTFTGDMEHLRVFYGLHGYGATHTVAFKDITVNGHLGKPPMAPCFEESIDIKPGSYPNCFNVNGHGVIPVAILGSADFDVTTIDVSSLDFGGLDVRVKGNGSPQCSVKDVSGDFTYPEGAPDGYDDLVCQFVDDSSSTWSPHDGMAAITGYLKAEYGGEFFWGEDEICIRPD